MRAAIAKLWVIVLALAGCTTTTAPFVDPATWTQPARVPLTIGIVAHAFVDSDAIAVQAMGSSSVRLSFYGDTVALAQQLSVVTRHHLQAIVVAMVPISAPFARIVGSSARVQVGNEPDNPIAYAGTFRTTYATWRSKLTLIPAGMANGTSANTLRAAIAAGLGDAGVLCLHVYGAPLVDAVTDRLNAATAAGWTGTLYFTEIGTLTPADLEPALAAIPASVPTWVYELAGTDGFTLTPAERRTIATFTAP